MLVRRTLIAVVLLLLSVSARAAEPVFDPDGTSFYDMPFPMELRRDADGSVELAGFPFPPGNALVDSYRVALERTRGLRPRLGRVLQVRRADRRREPARRSRRERAARSERLPDQHRPALAAAGYADAAVDGVPHHR